MHFLFIFTSKEVSILCSLVIVDEIYMKVNAIEFYINRFDSRNICYLRISILKIVTQSYI